MKTKQLALDAMLAAMCAVLGYLSADFGNFKFTFEDVPVILAALMFGGVDGLAVGSIGSLIYQLLHYGVSVTTPLWILPHALCGLIVGLYAKRREFRLTQTQALMIIVLSELLITVLNTGVIYLDSVIYGYYSFAYVFGTVVIRFAVCIVKAVVFALVIPRLADAIRRNLRHA